MTLFLRDADLYFCCKLFIYFYGFAFSQSGPAEHIACPSCFDVCFYLCFADNNKIKKVAVVVALNSIKIVFRLLLVLGYLGIRTFGDVTFGD
jgi:hypothetical protein